jgi:hypothetical protein
VSHLSALCVRFRSSSVYLCRIQLPPRIQTRSRNMSALALLAATALYATVLSPSLRLSTRYSLPVVLTAPGHERDNRDRVFPRQCLFLLPVSDFCCPCLFLVSVPRVCVPRHDISSLISALLVLSFGLLARSHSQLGKQHKSKYRNPHHTAPNHTSRGNNVHTSRTSGEAAQHT